MRRGKKVDDVQFKSSACANEERERKKKISKETQEIKYYE